MLVFDGKQYHLVLSPSLPVGPPPSVPPYTLYPHFSLCMRIRIGERERQRDRDRDREHKAGSNSTCTDLPVYQLCVCVWRHTSGKPTDRASTTTNHRTTETLDAAETASPPGSHRRRQSQTPEPSSSFFCFFSSSSFPARSLEFAVLGENFTYETVFCVVFCHSIFFFSN